MTTIKYQIAEIYAMPESSLNKVFAGAKIHAIDGMKMDPPPVIEAIGRLDKPEFDMQTIDITIWPGSGWMVGLNFCVDNGMTRDNALEIELPA
jgi:hypothetical protein